MDKIFTTPKPKKKLPKWYFLLAAAIAIPSIAYIFSSNGNKTQLEASQLIYAEVKKGDLDITINGYGVLSSENKKLLTSLTAATVEEILLKPGALVEKDSVILKLSNPAVQVAEKNALQILEQERANLRKLQLNHKRELLDEKSRLVDLNNQYKSVELNRKALQTLKEKGIVSRIQYDEVELEVQNLKEQITILDNRINQLVLVQEEEANIQQETIHQADRNHQTQQRFVEALEVKAGMQGVLQRLSVELGQSINEGSVLCLVGSVDKLTAQLKVSQTQAEKIAIGQDVVVDTRRDTIKGKVFRIDPTVENGTVMVEASLESPLPSSARPELSVDGKIYIGSFANTLYVERPVNIKENTTTNVFVVSDNRQSAEAKIISFGAEAGKYVQILDGVSQSDQVVLSDLSLYKNMDVLLLK